MVVCDAMWEGIEIGCDAARLLLLNVAEGRLCKEGVMCGPWPNGEGRERGERYRADDEGTLCYARCARVNRSEMRFVEAGAVAGRIVFLLVA